MKINWGTVAATVVGAGALGVGTYFGVQWWQKKRKEKAPKLLGMKLDPVRQTLSARPPMNVGAPKAAVLASQPAPKPAPAPTPQAPKRVSIEEVAPMVARWQRGGGGSGGGGGGGKKSNWQSDAAMGAAVGATFGSAIPIPIVGTVAGSTVGTVVGAVGDWVGFW